jgi:virginiamycin B lyase
MVRLHVLFGLALAVSLSSGFAEAGTWSPAPGVLKQVAVGSAGQVYGLTPRGAVVRWDGREFLPFAGALNQLSVTSGGGLWGLSNNGEIYRHGKRGWTLIPGRLKMISAGSSRSVWGLSNDGAIYRRAKEDWVQVPGALRAISAGAGGAVYGLSNKGKIYRYARGAFAPVPGLLSQISVGSAKHVWGLSEDGRVYQLQGGSFRQVEGKLAQLSVGADGEVWGISVRGEVFRYSATPRAAPKPAASILTKIVCQPAKATLSPGEGLVIKARAFDQRGRPMKATFRYRAQGGAMRGSSFVAGQQPGNYQVWVSHPETGVSRVVPVTIVAPVRCELIALSLKRARLYVGESTPVTARGYAAGRRPLSGLAYRYESRGGVVRDGAFWAGNTPGVYRLRCWIPGHPGKAEIEVEVLERLVCSSLRVRASKTELRWGESVRVTAWAFDQHGRRMPGAKVALKASQGTLSKGLYKAPRQDAVVTIHGVVAGGRVSGSVKLTVREPRYLTRIGLSLGKAKLRFGESTSIQAVPFDQLGQVMTGVGLELSTTGGGVIENGVYTAGRVEGAFLVWCRHRATNVAASIEVSVVEPVRLTLLTFERQVIRCRDYGQFALKLRAWDQYNRPCPVPLSSLVWECRGASIDAKTLIFRASGQVGHVRVRVRLPGTDSAQAWADVFVHP